MTPGGEGPRDRGIAQTAPKGRWQRLETKQRHSPHGRQSFPQNTGDIMWMALAIPSRGMPKGIPPLGRKIPRNLQRHHVEG